MLSTTTEQQFLELAERREPGRGIRIPVIRSLPADLHTPVSAWLKLRGRSSHSFLFESVEGGERLGRYSFVGGRPELLLRSFGQSIEIERLVDGASQHEIREGDPRQLLRELLNRAPLTDFPDAPRFLGGAVGFFGYDSVRLQERLAQTLPDPLKTPDINLALHNEVLAFDHLRSVLYLIRIVELTATSSTARAQLEYQRSIAKLDELEALLAQAQPIKDQQPAGPAPQFHSDTDQASFIEAVASATEAIRAGEIFQVVLSRRLTARLSCDPFLVYRALRILNPSPYQFFLELGEHTLIGASPEMLVRVEGHQVETMPIAGTRRRGHSPGEDERLCEELKRDPKERAEHQMLVDLGRNDIGRVARFGTVELTRHAEIERFSHVMHLVSRVRGQLRADQDALDALYACFPAGTVSGAPKVRAMEIIEQLEPSARGVYAGAVGYLDYGGDLDTCIAIRTAVHYDGQIHVQAGAGIVYDSIPEHEFKETENKARALIEAICWAEQGLLSGGLGPQRRADVESP
ncbi:MAG: anthranilate synthase component I [Rickettsiales bacterium]|nr:anthranilate synthase component I [Rickettsiales bacterium]